eukprot:4547240-Alexandrium_andersonii.AAC.1
MVDSIPMWLGPNCWRLPPTSHASDAQLDANVHAVFACLLVASCEMVRTCIPPGFGNARPAVYVASNGCDVVGGPAGRNRMAARACRGRHGGLQGSFARE